MVHSYLFASFDKLAMILNHCLSVDIGYLNMKNGITGIMGKVLKKKYKLFSTFNHN